MPASTSDFTFAQGLRQQSPLEVRHAELRTASADLAVILNPQTFADRQAAYDALVDALQSKKVTLDNGKTYSIYDLYEQEVGEKVCHCKRIECSGCEITDPADIETWVDR